MSFFKYSLLIIIIFLLIKNVDAQFSVYHGVVFPYDNINPPHSPGNLTFILSNYSLNFLNDSASTSNSFMRYPQIFLSFQRDMIAYKVSSDVIYDWIIVDKRKTEFTRNYEYLNFFSFILPVKFLNKKTLLMIALKKVQSPEYEIWLPSKKYADLDIMHRRDGNIWNATAGISHKYSRNLDISLSLTKWFGSWIWHEDNNQGFIQGDGEYEYSGNYFNVGVTKYFSKFNVYASFHSPFVLMKSKSVILDWVKREERIEYYNIRQQYNGAFKLGASYKLNNCFFLSIGYRFQNSSVVKLHKYVNSHSNIIRKNVENKYGSSHLISFTGNSILHLNSVKLPVYFSYWLTSQPNFKTPANYLIYLADLNYLGYQFFSNDKSSRFAHNFALGFKIPFRSITFHVTGLWHSSKINGFTKPIPQLYSEWLHVERFKAKKNVFTFDFGVSYTFNNIK